MDQALASAADGVAAGMDSAKKKMSDVTHRGGIGSARDGGVSGGDGDGSSGSSGWVLGGGGAAAGTGAKPGDMARDRLMFGSQSPPQTSARGSGRGTLGGGIEVGPLG